MNGPDARGSRNTLVGSATLETEHAFTKLV